MIVGHEPAGWIAALGEGVTGLESAAGFFSAV
jgi:D-arabinose 1-dehydrogenase-like Zn-dependent alcohol dehydrogenase